MRQPRQTHNISRETSTAKENLLNPKITNILKPEVKSTERRSVTTESTNVIPAPADRSDSWKVYIKKNGITKWVIPKILLILIACTSVSEVNYETNHDYNLKINTTGNHFHYNEFNNVVLYSL